MLPSIGQTYRAHRNFLVSPTAQAKYAESDDGNHQWTQTRATAKNASPMGKDQGQRVVLHPSGSRYLRSQQSLSHLTLFDHACREAFSSPAWHHACSGLAHKMGIGQLLRPSMHACCSPLSPLWWVHSKCLYFQPSDLVIWMRISRLRLP